MRRVTWFVAGAASGVVTAAYTQRRVKAVAARLAPANVAQQASLKARTKGHDLLEAVKDGRAAMRRKEAALRQERDGDDVVTSATSGQVIVLSDVRALDQLLDRSDVGRELPTGEGPGRPGRRRRRGRAGG